MLSTHSSRVDASWPRPTAVAVGFLSPVVPREADENDLRRYPPGHLHLTATKAANGDTLYNVRVRRHDGAFVYMIESTDDYTYALYIATSAYNRMHEMGSGEILNVHDEDNIGIFHRYFVEEMYRGNIPPEALADVFGLVKISKEEDYRTPYHLPEDMLFPVHLALSDRAEEFLLCRRSGDRVIETYGPYNSLNDCMQDLIFQQIKRSYLFDWINPRPSDGFRLPSLNASTSPYR